MKILLLTLFLAFVLAEYVDSSRDRRIVGGQEVVPHSHPFVVSLWSTFSGGFGRLCGGSIIAPRSVLTGANCITNTAQTNIAFFTDVIAGVHNRLVIEPNQQRQRVDRADYFWHANYGPNEVNDIAILRNPTPWTLTPFVQFVRLPFDHLTETFAGLRGTTLGWGVTQNVAGGQTSPTLRSANNAIITNAVCNAHWSISWPGVVNAGKICIGADQSQQGPCSGDWGGPLIVNDARFGGIVQVGIVSSFGASTPSCGLVPATYERVTFHRDWIVARMI